MPTTKDIIVKKPSADEIAECKTWPIWTSEARTFDWQYTQQETCYVIEGEVAVSDDTGSVTFGPGDLVIFPNDLECIWNVKQPIKKHYKFE